MDAKLQNVWVPEIGPGGLFTGTFEAEDCTLGTAITVWVCADDTNMVDESNENNNCMRNFFTCPILPQPDLVVFEKWEECVGRCR
jgi:subtilase family serine protease